MTRIPIRVEEEGKGRGRTGRLLKRLLPLALATGMALWFARLGESKKRFILHLVKRVPYLPGRYNA